MGSSLEAKFLDHPQLGRDALHDPLWPWVMGPWGFPMGNPRILYVHILYIYMYVYTINGIYCNGDIVYIIIWMNYNDLSVTSQYHLNILETLFHLLRVARVTTKKITAVGNLF